MTATAGHPTAGTGTTEAVTTLQSPLGVVLRRFALFVNGVARALLLPFGADLVYRLTHGSETVTPSTWSAISFRFALTVAIFGVGQHVGGSLASQYHFHSPHDQHLTVARLGGVASALLILATGAGMSSIVSLLLTRFLLAVTAGILLAITQETSALTSTKSTISFHEAKIYLTGFGVSTLAGGFIYSTVSNNALFVSLTGGSFFWSSLFFLTTMMVGEMVCRNVFLLTVQPENPSTGKVRKIFRRIVGGPTAASNSSHRVSFNVAQHQDEETMRLLATPADAAASRQRTASLASLTSASEYFDCNEEFGFEEFSLDGLDTHHQQDIALYKDRKCQYSDGRPAYVPPGDCIANVPSHYLQEYRGDKHKALRLWHETQRWRRERGVWKIHTTPNSFFYEIYKAYPHCPHGYSKEGYAVMYEQPGKMNLRALFQGACTIEDMIHHYIFFQEYVSNCICASQQLRKVAGKEGIPYQSADYGHVVVMDIAGAGVSMLSSDVVKYLSLAKAINQAHYPGSMKRVCVVNCPWFATGMFPTIKRLMPTSVKADLLGSDCIEGLRQYIDDDQIPPEYGGSSPYKLGEHPFTTQFSDLVDLAEWDAGEDSVDEEANHKGQPISVVVSAIPEELEAEPNKTAVAPPSTTRQPELTSARNDGIINPDQNIRRRGVSLSPTPRDEVAVVVGSMLVVELGEKGGIGVDSLAFVSFFCACWSGLQGAVEVAIPLWLSSPVAFGGLGYTPATSGSTLYCVSLLLLFLLTTKAAAWKSTLPQSDPLRALRFGLGTESSILLFLAFLPLYFPVENNSGLVKITAITLLAMGGLASIAGRSGMTVLRMLVADGLTHHLSSPSSRRSSSSVFSAEFLISECTIGRAANFLSLIAEVVGILVNSEIWSLSINREKPSKYDGSLFLIVPAFVGGCLYFLSHFLRLNPEKPQPPTFGASSLEGHGTPRKAV